MLLFNEAMEEFYWFGLKSVAGIGNVTFRRMLERFETPKAALHASPDEISTVKGVTPAVLEAIRKGAWQARMPTFKGSRSVSCNIYFRPIPQIPV